MAHAAAVSGQRLRKHIHAATETNQKLKNRVFYVVRAEML
jgi:hypothetical protein